MKRLLTIAGVILGVVLVIVACALPAVNPLATTPVDLPAATPTPAAEVLSAEAVVGAGTVPRLAGTIIEDGAAPPFSTRNWSTDFSRRAVEWREIMSGGPPKDGIPAIDDPQFESIEEASTWISERDPVIVFEHGGVTRAYPLAILMWHEIANDEIAGLPVSVTFCPLCNASIVFDRRFDGQVLDFGVSGMLRNSDLIMYDRQSESWWQQFTGEGIVGKYTGEQLRFLPSQVISFGDFVEQFPQGEVLARPAVARSYGRNPYTSYDSTQNPFLFSDPIDRRLPATERVVGLATEDETKAYAFSAVAEVGAINDDFDGRPVVIFHKPGTASALDGSEISTSKDVGSVGVFDRRADGQLLTFDLDETGNFVDNETGTRWSILGQGVEGPLAGEQLEAILHFDHFWFAWAAFFPDTGLYGE
jgi:hypothetical protein